MQKITASEAVAIANYKEFFSDRFGDVDSLHQVWIPEFEPEPDLDYGDQLHQYLQEYKPFVRNLVEAARRRQQHAEDFLLRANLEDESHRFWREGLNKAAQHGVEVLTRWEKAQDANFDRLLHSAVEEELPEFILTTENPDPKPVQKAGRLKPVKRIKLTRRQLEHRLKVFRAYKQAIDARDNKLLDAEIQANEAKLNPVRDTMVLWTGIANDFDPCLLPGIISDRVLDDLPWEKVWDGRELDGYLKNIFNCWEGLSQDAQDDLADKWTSVICEIFRRCLKEDDSDNIHEALLSFCENLAVTTPILVAAIGIRLLTKFKSLQELSPPGKEIRFFYHVVAICFAPFHELGDIKIILGMISSRPDLDAHVKYMACVCLVMSFYIFSSRLMQDALYTRDTARAKAYAEVHHFSRFFRRDDRKLDDVHRFAKSQGFIIPLKDSPVYQSWKDIRKAYFAFIGVSPY